MTVLKSICIINNQDDDTALSWEVYMEKKQVFIILGVVVFITVSIIAYCLLYGNQYTVKFDTNGGTEIEQQVVRVGDKVVEPKEPVKEGYEFVEWQLDGKKYNFETKVKRNMVLTAWNISISLFPHHNPSEGWLRRRRMLSANSALIFDSNSSVKR